MRWKSSFLAIKIFQKNGPRSHGALGFGGRLCYIIILWPLSLDLLLIPLAHLLFLVCSAELNVTEKTHLATLGILMVVRLRELYKYREAYLILFLLHQKGIPYTWLTVPTKLHPAQILITAADTCVKVEHTKEIHTMLQVGLAAWWLDGINRPQQGRKHYFG